MQPHLMNESVVVELYNKYLLMKEEVLCYSDFFLDLTSGKLSHIKVEDYKDRMETVGLHLVSDINKIKEDHSSMKENLIRIASFEKQFETFKKSIA